MDPIRSENICLFFEKLPAELRNEVYKSIYEVDVLPVDHGLTLRGQTTLEYSSKSRLFRGDSEQIVQLTFSRTFVDMLL
jgi:hypothetical protein